MNKNNVELKTMHCSGDVKILEFSVFNNNGKTTVQQKLVVEKLGEKWTAKLENDGIPPQDSAKEAAHKLGDWLVRLGNSINEEHKQFESVILK